jgi:hypothetical protein
VITALPEQLPTVQTYPALPSSRRVTPQPARLELGYVTLVLALSNAGFCVWNPYMLKTRLRHKPPCVRPYELLTDALGYECMIYRSSICVRWRRSIKRGRTTDWPRDWASYRSRSRHMSLLTLTGSDQSMPSPDDGYELLCRAHSNMARHPDRWEMSSILHLKENDE